MQRLYMTKIEIHCNSLNKPNAYEPNNTNHRI